MTCTSVLQPYNCVKAGSPQLHCVVHVDHTPKARLVVASHSRKLCHVPMHAMHAHDTIQLQNTVHAMRGVSRVAHTAYSAMLCATMISRMGNNIVECSIQVYTLEP